MGDDPQVLQQGGKRVGGCCYEDAVAFAEDKVAVRSGGQTFAQYRAYQNLAADDTVQIT